MTHSRRPPVNVRVLGALAIIEQYGQIDGAHHKAWVIDQVVRALQGDDKHYAKFIRTYERDGYTWDEGIAP